MLWHVLTTLLRDTHADAKVTKMSEVRLGAVLWGPVAPQVVTALCKVTHPGSRVINSLHLLQV